MQVIVRELGTFDNRGCFALNRKCVSRSRPTFVGIDSENDSGRLSRGSMTATSGFGMGIRDVRRSNLVETCVRIETSVRA